MNNPTQHHFMQKLLALFASRMAQGKPLIIPGVHITHIYHDPWCLFYKGKSCNCNPDIRLEEHER